MAIRINLRVKGPRVINPLSLVFGLLRKERSRVMHGNPEGRNPPDDTTYNNKRYDYDT